MDGKIVFLARPTTLVGAQSGTAEFTTQPLDVSGQGGAQFQVWRGPSSGKVLLYLEESLDGVKWVLGPSTPTAYELTADDTKFFSYSFRLRWFRLKAELVVTSVAWPKVTMWAEGLLRGGGAGVWPSAVAGSSPLAAGLAAGGVAGPVAAPGSVAGVGDGGMHPGMQALIDSANQSRQREIDAFLRDVAKSGK